MVQPAEATCRSVLQFFSPCLSADAPARRSSAAAYRLSQPADRWRITSMQRRRHRRAHRADGSQYNASRRLPSRHQLAISSQQAMIRPTARPAISTGMCSVWKRRPSRPRPAFAAAAELARRNCILPGMRLADGTESQDRLVEIGLGPCEIMVLVVQQPIVIGHRPGTDRMIGRVFRTELGVG